MKLAKIIFATLALLSSGCSTVLPPQENSGEVVLSVDKTSYSPNDTILVTLQNNGEEAVFLAGCSPIFISSQTDTGWSAAPLVVCFWEGYAQKLEAGRSFQERVPAAHFVGVHKFVAAVYAGCLENEPISTGKCRFLGVFSSPEFEVGGRDSGAGNLEITTERLEYSWRAEDLGSSRLVRATLVNKSDQTLYARLGDAMIGSIDQEDLHVAYGSHGHLEQWQAPNSWRELPSGILIEGVRFVALRPQQSHRLLVHLYSLQGNETGQFRVRVDYFERIDPPEGATPQVDYSNVFTIAH